MSGAAEATVQTVLGPIAASQLGPTLVHEHLFVGWPGWNLDPLAADARVTQYDALLERLRAAYAAGIRTIVDASPADLGRSAAFLQRASRDSGLHVIAASGIYHEAWGFHVYMKMRSQAELAEIFAHELTRGLDGGEARAGVIKVASAGETIGRHERRALSAAAEAAVATSTAVITHSSNAGVALDQAQTLTGAGIPPQRVQIGHCDAYAYDDLLRILATGVMVAFDQAVYAARVSLEGRVAMLARLAAGGHAGQLTLSHDQIGVLGGRQVQLASVSRSFSYLSDTLVPALRAAGVRDEQVAAMMIDNPRRLLAASRAAGAANAR